MIFIFFSSPRTPSSTSFPPSLSYSNKLRITRTTAPESLDPDAEAEERTTFLGYEDQPFRFAHLSNPVNVCGMDNVTEKGIVALEEQLEEWLNEV